MGDCDEVAAGKIRRAPQKLQTGAGYARGGRVAMTRYMDGGMVEKAAVARERSGAAPTASEAASAARLVRR